MKLLLILLLLWLPPSYALQDYYQFASKTERERFDALTNELRCLVCQNQTIADSNAGLAVDLRDKIYKQIQAGLSDKQILDYLIARYGKFIMYRPPLNAQTVVLWFTPFLFLIMGLSGLFYYVRRSK